MTKNTLRLALFLLLLPTAMFREGLQAQDTETLTLNEATLLYREADRSSAVLAELPAGQTVTVLVRRDSWLKVSWGAVCGYIPVRTEPHKGAGTGNRPEKAAKAERKDRFFLMGLGMLRINWSDVAGDAIRFRYSDLGLPADFSTRERASFTFDGSFEQGNSEIDGYLNYDPENRINEPPLDFLFNARRGLFSLSVGDYRQGVMTQAVFSRYLHPFRGAILGLETERLTLQLFGGMSRGESAVEQLTADLGIGPYYLSDSPVLRGSEMLFLVTRSRSDGQTELQRQVLLRNRDYHVDYDRGVIMLTFYLAPSDELGNPRFIEVAYQFESLAGRFTRVVFGARAQWQPWKALRLSASYLGDADQSLPLERILDEHRGILAFGIDLTSRRLDLQGELALGLDQSGTTRQAHFLGGQLRPLPNLHLQVNSWNLDSEFPSFANRQLEYGYSLMQLNQQADNRSVFLSPFQFTRNLGSELYPFSLAGLAVDESETHGILEWERAADRISLGYGQENSASDSRRSRDLYLSGLHQGERTVAWFKSGGSWDRNAPAADELGQFDLLAGWRQRLKRFAKGDLYVQADTVLDWLEQAGSESWLRSQVFSLSGEYLSGQNGLFAGIRRETVQNPESGRDDTLWAMEAGVKQPVWSGLFLDSRYRREHGETESGDSDLDYLSLGLGYERPSFRAMARYEVQINRLGGDENRRRVWSLFCFGSPWPSMSLSLQYLHQSGDQDQSAVLSRNGEEQVNFRFVWRPSRRINIYSQWRYDENLELLPPLDEIRSHSLAAVQGLKLSFGRRFETLFNYKLIRVWGPIENRKYSLAGEIGYQLLRHLRLGLGVEYIDYRDRESAEAEYRSTVAYLKLVAIY